MDKYCNFNRLVDKFNDDLIESIIQEMYKKPYLDFIDDLISKILQGELDFIQDKYRIIIIPVDRIDQRLIYNSSYDQFNYLYKFEIAHDVDELKDIEQILKQEFIEIYVHEETHEQQNKLKHKLQPYTSDCDLQSYLSQWQEIPAMARGVAYAIKSRTGIIDDKDIIRAIVNNYEELKLLPESFQKIISQYRIIGGKTWRKFIKNVYNIFQTLHYGATIEYRNWLKNNE